MNQDNKALPNDRSLQENHCIDADYNKDNIFLNNDYLHTRALISRSLTHRLMATRF